MSEIGRRKADHLALCVEDDVGFHRTSTLFECVKLVHDALPEAKLSDVDVSTTLFGIAGKKLRAPIVIASMTGGTEEAARINRELARVAEERGYAFGLGSQRAMHVRPGATASYRVRDVAPSTLVLGNVGVVQARAMTTSEVRLLVDDVGADALCIHLNVAMELVQPGGDRDFAHGLDTIGRLVQGLGVPVIVKETGCGLSPSAAKRLRDVGVKHVDVSGAGGTSWVGVETKRADAAGDAKARALGEALWDWGVPTAASVALVAPLGFETIIATGGMSTGLDAARAVALGASAAGFARPVLKALAGKGGGSPGQLLGDPTAGRAAACAFLDAVEDELRAAMLLTGSLDLPALRRAPRVIVGELSSWIDQLAVSTK